MEVTSNTDKITEADRIIDHLSKLHQARALLTVTLAGSSKLFNSIIVNVNAANGRVTLDKLFPEKGHELARKVGKFNIHTFLHGIEISFTGKLIKTAGSEQDVVYEIALPEKLFYRQRRAHYRVPVSVAQGIKVTLYNEQFEKSEGVLSNLSVGGIGVQFEGEDVNIPKEKGAQLPACEFVLPDKKVIKCPLELRFFYQDTAYNHLRIGGRFLHLSQNEERGIQRYIMQLEREILKTRPA